MSNQSGRIILILVLIVLVTGGIYLFLYDFNKPHTQDEFFVSDIKNSSLGCDRYSNDEVTQDIIWGHLPKEISELTYKKGKVSAGEATYQIYLLKSSNDCTFIPFLIEFEARGEGAYGNEDYKYRGVYIYNVAKSEVLTVMPLTKNLILQREGYGSNIWTNDLEYKFVLTESSNQEASINREYIYNVKNNKLLNY